MLQLPRERTYRPVLVHLWARNKDAFMNPFWRVKVPFHTKACRKEDRKVSTSVIRTISLIRYHSMGNLDKGVQIVEVAL